MNGGCVTCRVRSQEGALFAALCGVCAAARRLQCPFAMQACRRVIRVSTSESSERRRFFQRL